MTRLKNRKQSVGMSAQPNRCLPHFRLGEIHLRRHACVWVGRFGNDGQLRPDVVQQVLESDGSLLECLLFRQIVLVARF